MSEKEYMNWCLNKWAMETSMQSFGTPELYQQVILGLAETRTKQWKSY